jgi:hypothetical protein
MPRSSSKASKKKKYKEKYYFFPNPYEDCAFTKCPKCETKTKVRKFILLISIEPNQHSCRERCYLNCAEERSRIIGV